MIACPSCFSSRTLVYVDSSRHARCLTCGASWVQEGAWQHSINRPSNARGPRAVATITAPTGVSGIDLALAVVDELQRGHGAEILDYDVVNGVPEITAQVPVGNAGDLASPEPESAAQAQLDQAELNQAS